MGYVELSPVEVTEQDGVGPVGGTASAVRRGRRRHGHSVALGVLAFAVVASLLPVWTLYITFDPETGRLAPAEHPMYFPVLMLHVSTASVALITCVLQVWPWLRRHHPRVHRYVGRVYVFAGVLPAGITVLVLTGIWPFSAVTAVGQVLVAVLWLCITTYGFVLIRRGRPADHRRWMLRSFALTASVLMNQLFSLPSLILFTMQLDTRLAGSEDVLNQVSVATENWLGFTVSLLAVEWWLEREQLRRSALARARAEL
jgi:uncharacterized membrane protein YozB (DUF420 family)